MTTKHWTFTTESQLPIPGDRYVGNGYIGMWPSPDEHKIRDVIIGPCTEVQDVPSQSCTTVQDPTQPRDFLGHPLSVGDHVVYPRMSGRACQLYLAKLLSFEVYTQADEDESRRGRTDSWWQSYGIKAGTLKSATVQRVQGARWSDWGGYDRKPSRLTANAQSMVKVDLDQPLP